MRIHVLWEKAATPNTIWIEIVLSSHFWIYEVQRVLIFNALYCYDNQYGQYYIICVNWGLYFKDEELEIMSTFQARASGAVVSNIPKQFE